MTKRVALARALALDPEIVFLDEPTSGLDPIAAGEFDALIRTLQQTLGLTVFMVTHDLDSLHTVCDRIAALADGKIVADGPMPAMLASRASLGEGLFSRQALARDASQSLESEWRSIDGNPRTLRVDRALRARRHRGRVRLRVLAAQYRRARRAHRLPRPVREHRVGAAGRRRRAVQRHSRRRGHGSRARTRTSPRRVDCDDRGGIGDAGAGRHQGRAGIPGPDRRAGDRAAAAAIRCGAALTGSMAEPPVLSRRSRRRPEHDRGGAPGADAASSSRCRTIPRPSKARSPTSTLLPGRWRAIPISVDGIIARPRTHDRRQRS